MATVSTVWSPRAGGWRRWGIRQQLTIAATAAVTLGFLLGIFVLATLLHGQLTASLRSTVLDESHRLATALAASGPSVVAEPDQVDDGFQAQAVDASGHVVASWNHNVTTPIATLSPGLGEVVVSGESPIWVPGEAEVQDLVVASGVSYAGTPYVLLVGASQEHQHEAVTTMVKLLLFALPVLMLLTALAAYWLVKRSLAPVEEITDRVKGITVRSLTERVPVPEAHDEIGTLASTMNSMLARLEASQGAQTRFVSDASHELRSPLTTLAGALEIGSSAHDDRTWTELAPLMQAETARLQGLVADLLLLSRSDDRGLRLTLSEVDLDDLVDAETRRLRDSGATQVRRDVRAARVVGDREKLLKALRNLDDNAVRHARGVVLLSVEPLPEGGARIEVADDGSGVPEADRGRIFERFVRLDESRSRDSGGSGLGLAIVAEVVHAHGGTVAVEDSPLGGASFVIELPARPPEAAPRSLP